MGEISGVMAAEGAFDFGVRDIVYQRIGGIDRLVRVYKPAGAGPFPGVVLVHGGAWNNKDRTDGQYTALELANSGVVVFAIDFRNAPEAPYPASLQDINLAVRWAKANADRFCTSPGRIGIYGTSSGGHQALLAALRPNDPRYLALELAGAPKVDAKVAFAIAGWAVLYPWDRYNMAKAQGKADMLKSHETFFKDEATHLEATPTLILERGEPVELPPALQFQGTADEWTSVAQAERLAAAYRKRGGRMDLHLAEGERHTYLNEHPFIPNSVTTFAILLAFIRKHGGG